MKKIPANAFHIRFTASLPVDNTCNFKLLYNKSKKKERPVITVAIWHVELDARVADQHRKWLKRRGFISANYYSSNGFSLSKMRQLAKDGKLHAIRCTFGHSVRWYYLESQAELARIKGELSL